MILLSLFAVFLKMGFFTFGGGLAIIPFLQQLVDLYGWFSGDELASFIALAQMTPGAIGVNMATYAGITAGGISGGIVATLGLCVVSFIVPPIMFHLWHRVKEYAVVVSVFNSLKVVVSGLIAAVFLSLSFGLFCYDNVFIFRPLVAVLLIGGLFLNIKFQINNILFILAFGLLGMALQL